MQAIYTLGLGRHTPTAVGRLVQRLAATVVDIRMDPRQGQEPWTAADLCRLVGAANYVDVADLVNKHACTDDAAELIYEAQGDYATALKRLTPVVARGPVIVICDCPGLASCSRSFVGKYLGICFALPVIDLPRREEKRDGSGSGAPAGRRAPASYGYARPGN